MIGMWDPKKKQLKKIIHVGLPEKCYICGRTKRDLDEINEIPLNQFSGVLKDFYKQFFKVRLQKRELTGEQLYFVESRFDEEGRDDSSHVVSWGDEDYKMPDYDSRDTYIRYGFDTKEETDFCVGLGLEVGLIELKFKPNEKYGLVPEVNLTGREPTEQEIVDFGKKYNPVGEQVIEYVEIRNMSIKKVMEELMWYCKTSKIDYELKEGESGPVKNNFVSLMEGIIKQFNVHLDVYVCTICSTRLPEVVETDWDDDDERGYGGPQEQDEKYY